MSVELTRLRERRGLTQAELAHEVTQQGVPIGQSSISQYETGRFRPKPRTINALCAALNVDRSDLVTEKRVPEAA